MNPTPKFRMLISGLLIPLLTSCAAVSNQMAKPESLFIAPGSLPCTNNDYEWSQSTEPPINKRHIFCGEVKFNAGAWEAKGFHSKLYLDESKCGKFKGAEYLKYA